MTNTRRLFILAFLIMAVGGQSGCFRIVDQEFVPGTYDGDLACTIDLVDPSGSSAQDAFTDPVTLTVDAEGSVSVNGAALSVGLSVIRLIPTAELAFEVTAITNEAGLLVATLEPRPTLVGISIEGRLVERYRWQRGSIQASANTELLVTDASGTSDIRVRCDGVLRTPAPE